MSRLRGLIAPAWPKVALAASLGGVATLAGAALTATAADLLGRAGQHPASLLTLLAPVAVVRLFAVVRATARYGERFVAHDTALRIVARLRALAFGHVVRRPPPELLAAGGGDWLRRLSADIDRLERLYGDAVAPLGALAATVLAAALALAPFGFALAACTAVGLVGAGVVVPVLVWRRKARLHAELLDAEARLAVRLVDAVAGLADLLMSTGERRAVDALATAGGEVARRAERLERAAAAGHAGVALVSGLTAWAVLLLAAAAVRAGRLNGLALAALALGVLMAFEAARPAAGAVGALAEGRAAAERALPDADAGDRALNALGAPATGQACTPPAPRGSTIVARDLTVRYSSRQPPALDAVSFALAEGGRVAVVGPSGGGKSSLVHALCRLVPCTSGSVRLGGVEIADLPEDELRRRIAVLEQRPHLFATTVGDNLRLTRPDAAAAEQRHALWVTALERRVADLPFGLDTPLTDAGLSGGERRRLALARVVLAHAPIWLLDEPLAGLDEDTALLVATRLSIAARGSSVLWVTHDPVPAWTFDAVWRLDNGRMETVAGDAVAHVAHVAHVAGRPS